MSDVIIPLAQDVKVRIDKITISNHGNKQIDWLISARPVSAEGNLGQAIHTELQQTPIDDSLVTLAPPEGTVIEIAPGVSIPVGNIPGSIVYAWLQWYGEQLCDSRKEDIANIIKGVVISE